MIVNLGAVGSELSLGRNSSPESGNVSVIFKTISSHTVNVLLNQMIEIVVQVVHPYKSHKVVRAVSRCRYVPNGIVPCLKD